MRHDGHCVLFVGRSEADMESVVYQSPDVFSFHYFFQVAVHVHVENVDGQMVFLAHRSCGEVQDVYKRQVNNLAGICFHAGLPACSGKRHSGFR